MKLDNLDRYMDLPYTETVELDDDGDFVARVVELPGCVAHGKTPLEAMGRLQEVKRLWLEDALAANDRIPEPEEK